MSQYIICFKFCAAGDESAKNLSWKARWHIALDIGVAIRYLHEECIDGPIVDVFMDSWNVVICHGSSSLVSTLHCHATGVKKFGWSMLAIQLKI